MRLITRMIRLAIQHDKNLHTTMEGWTAQPLSVSICLMVSLFSDLRYPLGASTPDEWVRLWYLGLELYHHRTPRFSHWPHHGT